MERPGPGQLVQPASGRYEKASIELHYDGPGWGLSDLPDAGTAELQFRDSRQFPKLSFRGRLTTAEVLEWMSAGGLDIDQSAKDEAEDIANMAHPRSGGRHYVSAFLAKPECRLNDNDIRHETAGWVWVVTSWSGSAWGCC